MNIEKDFIVQCVLCKQLVLLPKEAIERMQSDECPVPDKIPSPEFSKYHKCSRLN